jgi:steroid delta-isomerase-like uncharacterized protein
VNRRKPKGSIMKNSQPVKVGLEAMLTPDNCALILVDHQPFQVSGVKSIDAVLMINNVVALAKAAKAFGVPTLLSTVVKDRGGLLIKELQAVFPDQVPIDRTTINTWEDERCVKWMQKTGRKKLVMAALWTEICLAFPVIHALGDGYDVFFVTDASGGTSVEAHEMGVLRMIQAALCRSLRAYSWRSCNAIGRVRKPCRRSLRSCWNMAAPAQQILPGSSSSLRAARAPVCDHRSLYPAFSQYVQTGRTIKKYLPIMVCLILCLPVHAQDRSTIMKDVTLWYEAFNKKDPALVKTILSESWVDIPAAPGQPPGPKGVAQLLDELTTIFPDFKVTPAEILQDGNKVIVRSEITGTQRAPFVGFPAKNRKMTIQAIDIHEFKDGKIVRTWHTEDWMTGLHQLGALDK